MTNPNNGWGYGSNAERQRQHYRESVSPEDFTKSAAELKIEKIDEQVGEGPYPFRAYGYSIRDEAEDIVAKVLIGESDPIYGTDLKQPGTKADAGKSPVLQGCFQYFPRALLEVARVSECGAKKYSWKGWESVSDGINRYGNALGRHLLYETTEGAIDKDTGLLHAAQEAWNALARLELILREMEKK